MVCGSVDSVAEWLRRWIANPLLFERASSNLATVVIFAFFGAIAFLFYFVIMMPP